MILHKQTLLKKISGHDPLRHITCPCNILEEGTSSSIEAVFENRIDFSRKTLVISEGLVNYFSLPVISRVWQRIANLLADTEAGTYITEIYPDLKDHPYYRL